MEVYLDNSATTRPYDEVADIVYKSIKECYGNPSSLHRMGIKAENAVSAARHMIASSISAEDKEIYFTSGGTEANNIALMGFAHANKKRGTRIISTRIEHPSVTEPCLKLVEEGFDVQLANINSDGTLDIEHFKSLLTPDTILISVMAVNNETGAVQPVPLLRELANTVCPKAKIHTDCVQAYGKLDIDAEKWGIDMLSISAHKIHGLKGTGALYVRDKTIIHPTVFGGHQEKNLRSGTEGVINIIAFGKAAEITMSRKAAVMQRIFELKDLLISGLSEIPDVNINGNGSSSPILNVSFGGLKSEVVLHTLEDKGIFVSSGSACSSNKPSRSSVLTAMGMSRERIDSAVRFSLSGYTTQEEIKYCIEVLKKEIPLLYRYMRKK